MNPLQLTSRFLALLGSTSLLFAAEPTTWTPTAEEGWRPVDFGDLLVKPGSALDFSYLVEAGPAGKYGYVIVNQKGELVFEKKPETVLRFFDYSDCMEWCPVKTPEQITEYVRQIRLAGYNCMRPQFLDDMLMINTTEDGVMNPEQLDRWDRLSAELKKQGIYLTLDIHTSEDSFIAMPKQGDKRNSKLKPRIFWDPAAREHWARSMKAFLEHVNPYTGVALKDEPQLVFFALRNESGYHFQFREKDMPAEVLPAFRQWLTKRYQTIAALNAAWASQYKGFDEVVFPKQKGVSTPAADLQRFIVDSEVETFRWLKAQVDLLKTRSLVIDYNVGIQFGHNLSRSLMPIVDTHAYHDHPTSYVTPGSAQPNSSAVPSGLDYFTWINESRHLDRPFVVTEWGCPYWNQWRYEAGLSVPPYAALQGWPFLTQHSEAIRLQPVALRPFKLANDPPGKLSERMSALLYARGDVSPATSTVEVRLDPEGIFSRWGGEDYFPGSFRKLPLLVRTGIRVVDYAEALPGAKTSPDAVLRIHPEKREMVWTDDPDLTAEQKSKTPALPEMISYLRKRGLISADNKTDPEKGIYESQTKQLTVNLLAKTISVDTPRSQGVAMPQGTPPMSLSDVTFTNLGESGAFFVSGIDSRPIKESRRLLILTAGDALNSNELYESKKRKVLKKIGTLPILVKPLQVSLEIRRRLAANETAHLWALAYNGDRLKEIPVEILPDRLRLRLNTGDFATPLFHFELLVETKP